jgi:hypothetical protein
MASAGQVMGFLAIAGILLLVGGGNKSGDPDPENKLHDIMRDDAFLAQNPNFPEAVRELIAAHGFECARIGILWDRGQSPFGLKLEAFCGPVSSTGIFEAQHYAVYPEKLMVSLCKANGVFSNGCGP